MDVVDADSVAVDAFQRARSTDGGNRCCNSSRCGYLEKITSIEHWLPRLGER